jgi:hypothetical protein
VTLSFEQFRERMIDYLYEQLTGEELRAFEAYLRESAEARRELSALQSTLRSAREGLAQGVAEQPPARVRGAVLAAAHAQVLEAQRAARSTRVVAARADESSYGRRLRASWLLPTLGVAAAVALVVFGKNSESLEPSRRRAAPSAVSAPAEGKSRADEPAAPPPTAAESEASARASGRLEEGTRQPADRQRVVTTHAARAPAKGFAVPPPAWVAKRKSELPRQHEPGYAEAPAQPSAARGAALDAQDERAANQDKRAAKVSGSAQESHLDEPAANDALGAAPASPAARAPAPAPTQRFADELLSGSLEGAKPAPADDASAHSVTALLRRANEHVAAKRWPEAEADFRELLRRYPADARAPSWKKQFALVTQALRDSP